MTDQPTSKEPLESTPEAGKRRISFHYLKSNHFRVAYASGIIGSPTFDGRGIELGFYNERAPIPLMEVREVSANGIVSPPVEKNVKEGVVREVEIQIIMPITSAKSLLEWLKKQIAEAEEIQAIVESRKEAARTEETK